MRERTVQNTKEPLSNNWRQLSRLGRERTQSTEYEKADLQQLETAVTSGTRENAQYRTRKSRSPTTGDNCHVWDERERTPQNTKEPLTNNWRQLSRLVGERTHSTEHERAALQQLETTVTSGRRENAQYRTRKSRSPTTGDNCHVWDVKERTVQNTKEPLSNNWRQLSRLGRERTHSTEHERAALQQLETTVTSGTRENAQYRSRKIRSPITGDNCHV